MSLHENIDLLIEGLQKASIGVDGMTADFGSPSAAVEMTDEAVCPKCKKPMPDCECVKKCDGGCGKEPDCDCDKKAKLRKGKVQDMAYCKKCRGELGKCECLRKAEDCPACGLPADECVCDKEVAKAKGLPPWLKPKLAVSSAPAEAAEPAAEEVVETPAAFAANQIPKKKHLFSKPEEAPVAKRGLDLLIEVLEKNAGSN